MKELNQKLAIVQTKLKTKKTSYNAFGKYYFRKAEDILEAVKPFLLEQGVSVTISESIIATDPVPTLQSTATISDGKDATNDHGKKSNVVNKIKQAAKPSITAEQLQKAREYVAAGGKIEAIESKYKLTNEQRKDITKAKK
jgi:hypothetical protein